MQLFEDYQQARQKLLDYFAVPCDYQINSMLIAEWKYDWREYKLYWSMFGAEYTNDVISVYEVEGYTMFLVYSDPGGHELVIFDKAKELKNV